MGADNSRIFSPSEDEDAFYGRSYRRMGSGRKEATSTTIDMGFAIHASKASGGNGLLSDGEFSMLGAMVS